MAGVPFFLPNPRQLSIGGLFLPSFKLKFFVSGTLTPATVYANASLTTPLGTVVQADIAGMMPAIYLDPTRNYRVQVTDASDVLQPNGDVDPCNIPGSSVGVVGATSVSYDNTASMLSGTSAQAALDEINAARFAKVHEAYCSDAGAAWNVGTAIYSLTQFGASNSVFFPSNANALAATHAVESVSAAAINSNCGVVGAQDFGNVYRAFTGLPKNGGFLADFAFGFKAATGAKSDMRVLVGVNPRGSYAANVEPSTMLNCFFLGKDSGDANLQAMVNDGAGTCTKTDLGITAASLMGKLLRLRVYSPPGGASMTLNLHNISDDLHYIVTAVANLPALDTAMALHMIANTGPTTATAVSIRGIKVRRESNYI